MPAVRFTDRTGVTETLRPEPGEQLAEMLLRHRIPPASVLTLSDGRPVADTVVLDEAATYDVSLIEGYDIASIRDVYSRLGDLDTDDAAYVKQRIVLARDGRLQPETQSFNLDDLGEYVETTVRETCTAFNLLGDGSRVLVGLSGGVDSGSLLLTLAALRQTWPSLEIVAATFEDFDMGQSRTFQQAAETAEIAQAEHVVAPAGLAEEIFKLKRPLSEVLPALMQTPDRHHAMYVDSHTTRRILEVMAERRGIDRIALGLHATDLVAGLLNGFMTGYPSGSLPARTIREHTFVYPLAFLAKRELHLYFLRRAGRLAQHTSPNPWERDPLDRNFYYYLADHLQAYWPSLELMLIAGQERSSRAHGVLHYGTCSNCGSAYMQMPLAAATTDECDVCCILRRAGFVD